MQQIQTTLGDLIVALYEELLELYGDEEMAGIATAAMLNHYIAMGATEDVAEQSEDAAA